MRIYKILENKNVVDCNTVSHTCYRKEEQHLTFKMVFNGEQVFKFNKKELLLFPDSFICLAPGAKYETVIDANEPVKTISVSIALSFLRDFSESDFMPVDSFIHPLSKDMWLNMHHMYKRLEEKEDSDLLINEYLYHSLKIYYAKHYQDAKNKLENLAFVRKATKEDIYKRLNRAKEFISNNYNKKFMLGDVAAVACLSPNHLLRTFKQAFGISPYQYLATVRLQRAKILLETGRHSVNEIVLEVGFESTSTFIKLFKSNFNCTPLKYRKSTAYQLN